MCGITGFVGQGWRADGRAAATLDRMCRLIAHRGPDDQGTMVADGVAIGMRRLSIIDLAGGRQPISGEDGTATIVFNGEIYNYRELRRDLESRGHRFRTDSDTEAIVHAYEEFGDACVERLRGMFAFAIWDARRHELFCARDRLGKKPLYYTLTRAGTLVFGSELKSVVAHPEVEREVDPHAVDGYLSFGYVPEPLAIYRGVFKLPPGHTLRFADGRVSVRPYWDLRFDRVEARDEDEAVEELRALLDEAVRVRLVADVPLGAFLSGGVDSSAVVGMMARHADRPVKTFSIGFREDDYDELQYARVAAQRFGTEHHEFVVTPEICHVVDELVWHFDEPFADASAVPTYMVSKLAREHVKVVLTGDGGDEVFGGYTRYATDLARGRFEAIPGPIRRGVSRAVERWAPHGAPGRNFLHAIAHDRLGRYVESVALFTSLNKRLLYTDGFRAAVGGDGGFAARFREYGERASTGEPLDALLMIDTKTYLPGDILTKVDRMSMAVSLESRAPLLDHELVEFAASLPASLKIRGGETKRIFKRALRGFVSDEILDRAKQGFGMPLERWINAELRARIRETITGARARERGYVEPRYVATLLDEHERGRRNHTKALWSLFMLELWHRSIHDDRAAADVETDERAIGAEVGSAT